MTPKQREEYEKKRRAAQDKIIYEVTNGDRRSDAETAHQAGELEQYLDKLFDKWEAENPPPEETRSEKEILVSIEHLLYDMNKLLQGFQPPRVARWGAG